MVRGCMLATDAEMKRLLDLKWRVQLAVNAASGRCQQLGCTNVNESLMQKTWCHGNLGPAFRC